MDGTDHLLCHELSFWYSIYAHHLVAVFSLILLTMLTTINSFPLHLTFMHMYHTSMLKDKMIFNKFMYTILTHSEVAWFDLYNTFFETNNYKIKMLIYISS